MKRNLMSIPDEKGTVKLSEETKKELIKEVKETLVPELSENDQKKFTIVDMWNRHRNGRSASDRIRRWNLN